MGRGGREDRLGKALLRIFSLHVAIAAKPFCRSAVWGLSEGRIDQDVFDQIDFVFANRLNFLCVLT